MTEVRARSKRYVLFDEIASGGMASVHYGRSRGAAGFARTVAIKRMHAAIAKDASFAAMFVDEARVAARIHHPSVVEILDVVAEADELLLILEYVHGESVASLIRKMQKRSMQTPVPIAGAIATSFLHGLHAAHEATDESGAPLEVIHRDVSPQNVLVGTDGLARLLDFGVAKARSRLRTTGTAGVVKGKFAYMPPEQLAGGTLTRTVDVYAAGIVLWEMLTARWLFDADDERVLLARVMHPDVPRPSSIASGVPPELDRIVMRALAIDPEARFATAREMAIAIEDAIPIASATRVGAWVEDLAGEALAKRAKIVAAIERSDVDRPPSSEPLSGAVTVVAAPPSFGERDRTVEDFPRANEEVATVAGVARAQIEPTRVAAASTNAGDTTVEHRRLRIGLFAALAVIALVVLGIVGAEGFLSRGKEVASAGAGASSSTTVTTSETKPPTATTSASATATATATTSAKPHPASGSTLGTAIPKTKPSVSAVVSALPSSVVAKPDCDPPYVYDGAGHKVYKLECL